MTRRGLADMPSRPLPLRALKAISRMVWVVLVSRRQLNLPRWVRGHTFADLHSVMVAWLDSHFAMVERSAPWLHRVGSDVWDYCKGSVHSPVDISFAPRVRASAGCVRDVIVVYGFDGDLPERIRQLVKALSAAGWGRMRPHPDGDGYTTLSWRPNAELSCPPGMEGVPPWGGPALDPHMWLSWSSQGQATRLRQDPNRALSSSRNYLAVESTGTEYWKLPDEALNHHNHTLAVHIRLAYYSNLNPLARRCRIPRYLLPTPIALAGPR